MYQAISLYAVLGWFGLLAVCLALNELCRLNKWFSLLMFLVLPAILTFTLWPHTAGPGTTMNTWFYWVKTYSVLAGCLGFMAIRFVPGLAKNKWVLFFPALILAVNIGEAHRVKDRIAGRTRNIRSENHLLRRHSSLRPIQTPNKPNHPRTA